MHLMLYSGNTHLRIQTPTRVQGAYAAFGVVSGSLSAVINNQKAELVKYLLDASTGSKVTTTFGQVILSMLTTRIVQLGVSRMQSMLNNKGFEQYRWEMLVAVTRKIYSIDLSTFELKFKKKGQVRPPPLNNSPFYPLCGWFRVISVFFHLRGALNHRCRPT